MVAVISDSSRSFYSRDPFKCGGSNKIARTVLDNLIVRANRFRNYLSDRLNAYRLIQSHGRARGVVRGMPALHRFEQIRRYSWVRFRYTDGVLRDCVP